MKYVCSMGVLLMMTLSVFAEVATPGSGLTVVVARYDSVDQAQFDQAVEHLQDRLRIQKVVTLPVQNAESSDLATAAKQLAGERPETADFVVGLIAATGQVETHGSIIPVDKVGLINVAALRAGTDEDPALLDRRIKKEVVRVGLLLAGMKPCINPRCVLRHNKDLAELDVKGLGPCPPCLMEYGRMGKE